MMIVKRFDNFEIQKDNVIWAETPEGYLKFENLIATTTGEFPYRKDGKIVHEIRTPEEVFKQEHLDSFVGKSITLLPSLGHPKELLNPENDAKYGVGTIISAEKKDEKNLSIAGVIKNADAIQTIKSNIISSKDRRIDSFEGSCGYTLELDGLTQRNLHCNHFSIVAKGRAGAITKLNRDYDDMGEDSQNSANSNSEANQKTNDNNSNNINSSSKDMSNDAQNKPAGDATQVAVPNSQLIELQKKLDEANSALELEKGKNAAMTVKQDSSDSEVKALKARLDTMDAISTKRDMIEKAQSLGIKLDEALKDINMTSISPRDLAIKLINTSNPEIKLDSATDDYVMGAFSALSRNSAVRNDSLYSNMSGAMKFTAEANKGLGETARDGVMSAMAEFVKQKTK